MAENKGVENTQKTKVEKIESPWTVAWKRLRKNVD